jgi:hypothetical protein
METAMSPKRRQIQIPGTERKAHPEVEEAAGAYVVVRDERAELSKREAQKKMELLAVMRAHKLAAYKFYDDNGEELVARIDDGDPKVSVRRTGEAEPEIGEGISSGEDTKPAGMDGLIAQAMAAQDNAASVEVTDDGDVVVPEKAAPKKARKGKKRA